VARIDKDIFYYANTSDKMKIYTNIINKMNKINLSNIGDVVIIYIYLIYFCTSLVWLGGVLAIWIADGRPKHGEGSAAYISDVGAEIPPLFIIVQFNLSNLCLVIKSNTCISY
jgi:hypothetical protein